MIDRDSHGPGLLARADWLSTAFVILSPACATVVASTGHAVALAVLFWTLGAACPIAWIVGEVRRFGRRAVILAAAGESREESDGND